MQSYSLNKRLTSLVLGLHLKVRLTRLSALERVFSLEGSVFLYTLTFNGHLLDTSGHLEGLLHFTAFDSHHILT